APAPAHRDQPITEKIEEDTEKIDVSKLLAPAEKPGELGRLGPYRVLKVLSQGGMGVVLEAEDTKLARRVALKVIRPDESSTDTARQRFLQEARAVAGIQHDHVITIYQVDEDRNVLFLAMQLLQGETLSDQLAREGSLEIDELVRIAREIAE